MKKLLILSILIAICIVTNAQDKGFYYGTRISLGESDLRGGQLENPTGKLFWQIGAASAFQFSEHIGITADFLLSGKGTKSSGEHTASGVLGPKDYKYKEKISLVTGDVPLTIKLSFGITDKLYLKAFAGPSINFQFGGLHTLEYENESYNNENGFENKNIGDNLETMNLAYLYGAGLEVKSGDGRLFFLDFRMSDSKKAVGSLNGKGIVSSYMGLSAGYLFH